MGETITIREIEIINGGVLQIDIWYETKNIGDRIFCDADKFFEMFGNAMQRNVKSE